jgi:hypothetical protein
MRREKHFEQLLEQHQLDRVPLTGLDANDAARLAAADTFASLNAIEVPSDVASRIEARVRSRTAMLQTAEQNALPRRSSLRQVPPRLAMRRSCCSPS